MPSIPPRPPDPRSPHTSSVPGPRARIAALGDGYPGLSDDFAVWVDELAATGLDRRVAHRLTLVTVVLVALREMPSFVGDAAEHIEVALSDLDTYEVVQVALVDPDLDEAWDALAEMTSSPVSARCRALARLCRRHGLQVVAS